MRDPLCDDGPAFRDEGGALWDEMGRILLVEDHVDTRQTLNRLLERRGYTVREAGDVASAMEVAQEYDFDVLVSDIGLPDGTGMDLMRRLREFRLVPGIALS